MIEPVINLHLGDCMEAMAKMPDNAYNLAIVDPPYGIGAENHAGKEENGWKQWDKKDWDKEPPNSEYWKELFRVSENQIVWGANYYPQFLYPSMGWIVWDKGQRGFSLADGELAFSSFNRAMRVCDLSRGTALSDNIKSGGKIHPTQKPVALYKWLLHNYAKEGDKILDTHGGSMSIALACHEMGFDLDLWELDPEYYQKGVKRFNQHKAQLRMF